MPGSTPVTTYAALTLEGALLSPATLQEVAGTANSDKASADYALPRGTTLRDEIARYFRIGQATFRHLHASPQPSLAATQRFTHELLTEVLRFPPDPASAADSFASTSLHLHPRVPVVVVPPSDTLESASSTLRTESRRRSAATALQDYLNAEDQALWGLCTNGLSIRLLRDNNSLTRAAFLDFDLQQIFVNEDFASFSVFWLLLHATRFGKSGSPVSDCPLERWREAGAKKGQVALKELGNNVHDALLILANGFLSHPGNEEVRAGLQSGRLILHSTTGTESFFSQLLRLVYRLIFLLAAEDRDLLHPLETPAELRNLYAQGYSLGNLRDRAFRRPAQSDSTFDDRWQGLLLTFRALQHGEPATGLPALGGLFSSSQTPDLDRLSLSNRDLLQAIYQLAWLRTGPAPVPVNWRDMQTEELGSVYEGLLELTPRLDLTGRVFEFAQGAETKGNERKTSGSYYTPDSLVQLLLDSALDPVLDRLESESGSLQHQRPETEPPRKLGAPSNPALSGWVGSAEPSAHSDPAAHLLTITVLDPACGSGHFLLAAARRIASRVARLRHDELFTQDQYRLALRDVVRQCIYGVDRNPMAVELSRVALWIETVEPGKPLGFLDANLRCGDALLGIFSLEALYKGIPEAAYKALAGDDPKVAGVFKARNKEDLKGQGRLDFSGRQTTLPIPPALAAQALALRTLPEDSEQDITLRQTTYDQVRKAPDLTRLELAADLYTAAFLIPKVKPSALKGRDSSPAAAALHDMGALAPGGLSTPNPEFPGLPFVPVTSHVWKVLDKHQILGPLAGNARQFAADARAFHWPLEFPHILLNRNVQRTGFDVVLGNPPWERIKLQEQEFFAAREPAIAAAPNAAARGRLIGALKAAPPDSPEGLLHQEFELAKRTAEAASLFARVPADDCGRFPLTGRGDVNTYALFAELFSNLTSQQGRAGVIVPTGIATDATTAPFFASLVEDRRLARLVDFENSAAIFENVHRSYKFSLLTTAHAVEQILFTFFLTDPAQIIDPHRTFPLSAAQIAKINPNTKTAPVFRSTADADLTARIYARVPVLIDDTREDGNPWGLSFARLFDMSNDSNLFRTAADFTRAQASTWLPPQRNGNTWLTATAVSPGDQPGTWLPLYEAKLIHQFDHRWATYDALESRDVTLTEKQNPTFEVTPRYWVHEAHIQNRLSDRDWPHQWLTGWRDICRSTDERTVIASALPVSAVGHTMPLLLCEQPAELLVCLLANLDSLVLDYVARQKVGGTHLTYGYLTQFPVLPPTFYTPADLAFIVPRVLELTYTSYSMTAFARDLGWLGEPFAWDEDRRALRRAELDAFYARAYGLSRDDLRYILDPKAVLGEEYPSETFRVLKNNETKKFGEYRTQRLVLEAWDRHAAGRPPAGDSSQS